MLGIEKRVKAMYGDVPGAEKYDVDPAGKVKTAGETAKLGFTLGALAILLAIGLYVAQDMRMQRTAADLSARLDAVASPAKEIQALGERLTGLDGRLAKVEGLPAQARRDMLSAFAGDLAARAGQLGALAGAPEQQARIKQIQDLLDQYQKDLK